MKNLNTCCDNLTARLPSGSIYCWHFGIYSLFADPLDTVRQDSAETQTAGYLYLRLESLCRYTYDIPEYPGWNRVDLKIELILDFVLSRFEFNKSGKSHSNMHHLTDLCQLNIFLFFNRVKWLFQGLNRTKVRRVIWIRIDRFVLA